MEAHRREDDDRPAGHQRVERRPQLVRDLRVDQHRRVGRLEERAPDLLGPVGGAPGSGSGSQLGCGAAHWCRPGAISLMRRASPSAASSVSSGSSDSPVCTGEVWMTVLDGATSQWKRSDCSSRATGPALGSPAAIAGHRVEVRAHLGGVEPGGERRPGAPRRARCARPGSGAGGRRTRRRRSCTRRARPAGRRARSRTGTAHAPRRASSASAANARGARAAARGSRRSARASAHSRRARRHRVAQHVRVSRSARRASASSSEPASGSSTWSAIAGNGSAASAAGSQSRWWKYSAAPWSISHSAAVPDEQVRVARRAVDVGHQRVEPDDLRGRSGAGWRPAAGV